MSTLHDIYVKKDVLKKLYQTLEKKGENGISLTISISDETNQYGQNVSGWVSQTKEQREAKKERYFVGNGKVFWTDGNIQVAKKKEQGADSDDESDGLPF